MENKKINVAELLKDCPKGMKLNCTMFENLYFEKITKGCIYPILCYSIRNGIETPHYFTKEGCYHADVDAKCVIFPKGKDTWEGFNESFVNGDVIVDKTGAIAIYKQVHNSYEEPIIDFHCKITSKNNGFFHINGIGSLSHCWEINSARYATEEEKEKLFQAIKDNGYIWNPKSKCLEKSSKFKNGDILVGLKGSIFIFNELIINDVCDAYYSSICTSHCGLDSGNRFKVSSDNWTHAYTVRFATEKEKEKLFKAIKDNGYKWNEEKKCLDKLSKFNDGDILAYDNTSLPSTVFIYRNYNPDWNTGYFVALSGRTGKFYKDASGALDYYNPNVRFATEEEKEKLFQAIESKGYKWNNETKTLEKLIVPKFKVGDKIISIVNEDCEAPAEKGVISKITDDMYVFTDGSFIFFSSQDEWELVPNKFDINTLVSFEDKVLVRDEETDKWMPATWGFYDDSLEFNYTVEGGNGFNMCIPYKGNEHLLGSQDNCDEFYKTWE